MVFAAENQIDAFWRAIGRTDLADDPRFRRNPDRLRHRDELTDVVDCERHRAPSWRISRHRAPWARCGDRAASA